MMGTVWAAILFLVSFAKNIVLVPVMLGIGGELQYRYWVIIISSRAVFQFLPDGYIRYTANRFNLEYHTGRLTAIRNINAALIFLVVYSIAFLLLLVGVSYGYEKSVVHLFNTPQSNVDAYQLTSCLVFYMGGATVHNIARMYSSINEPVGRFWLSLCFESVVLTAEVSAVIAVVSNGGTLFDVCAGAGTTVALTSIVYLVILHMITPNVKIFGRNTLQRGFRAFTSSFSYHVQNFFEKITTESIVILLSLYKFHPAMIPVYSSVRTISNTPVTANNLLISTFMPELQRAYALGESRRIMILMQLLWLVFGTLGGIAIVFLYPWFKPLFLTWTKGSLPYDPVFFGTMLITCLLIVYGSCFTWMLKGINALQSMLVATTVKGVLLIVIFGLVPQQLRGIGFALLLTEAVANLFFYPRLMNRQVLRLGIRHSFAYYLKGFFPFGLTALCLSTFMCYGFSYSIAFVYLFILVAGLLVVWSRTSDNIKQTLKSYVLRRYAGTAGSTETT